jgi:hypothetical protein
VVVPDPSLETFGINTFLNDVFQTFITDKNVKPLTLMSVQEFEDVLQACRDAQVSWPELLESRYDGSRVRFGSDFTTVAKRVVEQAIGEHYCAAGSRMVGHSEIGKSTAICPPGSRRCGWRSSKVRYASVMSPYR